MGGACLARRGSRSLDSPAAPQAPPRERWGLLRLGAPWEAGGIAGGRRASEGRQEPQEVPEGHRGGIRAYRRHGAGRTAHSGGLPDGVRGTVEAGGQRRRPAPEAGRRRPEAGGRSRQADGIGTIRAWANDPNGSADGGLTDFRRPPDAGGRCQRQQGLGDRPGLGAPWDILGCPADVSVSLANAWRPPLGGPGRP